MLRLLGERLRAQRATGCDFLVGERLSAVDVYWAVSSNLFVPLPPDALPLSGAVRENLEREAAPLIGDLEPALLEHRDSIYRRFLRLPVEL